LPRPARRNYPARITPDCVDDSNLDIIENAQGHVTFFITAIGSDLKKRFVKKTSRIFKIDTVLFDILLSFPHIPFEATEREHVPTSVGHVLTLNKLCPFREYVYTIYHYRNQQ
jgi:hypothetical protein